MKAIGTVVHTGRPGAVEAAARVGAYFADRGISVADAESGADLDLIIAFGGDGTLLRAAQVSGQDGPPVLGVNHGQLGFLTSLERDLLDASLPAIAEGRFEVEERTLLSVEIDGAMAGLALNDAVVEKPRAGRAIRVDLDIAADRLISWAADAVIVATPTGSTAYSLSAGGPIASPRLDVLVVTPVAPHGPFARSLVVPPDEVVRIRLWEQAALALDGGEPHALQADAVVTVRRAEGRLRLARLEAVGFWGLVRDKFGLNGGPA